MWSIYMAISQNGMLCKTSFLQNMRQVSTSQLVCNGNADVIYLALTTNTDDQSPLMISYTFSHVNHSYVNLEDLEPILHAQDAWCSEPYSEDHDDFSSIIQLPFIDANHFEAAKAAWGDRDDVLFVMEHASCFEGADERSVYKCVWTVFSFTQC